MNDRCCSGTGMRNRVRIFLALLVLVCIVMLYQNRGTARPDLSRCSITEGQSDVSRKGMEGSSDFGASAVCPHLKDWESHFNKWLAWFPADTIIDNTVYFKRTMVPTYPFRQYPFMAQLVEAVEMYPQLKLPNIEFLAAQHDGWGWRLHEDDDSKPAWQNGLARLAPMTQCSYVPWHTDVPVPDHTFYFYQEGGGNEWERGAKYSDLIKALLDRGAQIPYENRIRKALFRGADHPDRHEALRAIKDHVDTKKQPWVADMFDFSIDKTGTPVTLRDHATYAILLSFAGSGYSARMKYLLATGSPVLHFRGSWRGRAEEFFYPMLRPMVDYIPYEEPHDVSVIIVLQWLLDNPAEAKRIGENGRRFVEEHLTPRAIGCFWRYFAFYYAPKLAQPVVRDPDTAVMSAAATVHEYCVAWNQLFNEREFCPDT